MPGRVVGWGIAATCLLFVGGWIEGLPRIERDLEGRAVTAASAAGYAVTADFSGQDGTVRCAVALDSLARATVTDLIDDIKGVRVVKFDSSCVAEAAPTPVEPTAVESTLAAIPGTDTAVTEPAATEDIVSLAASAAELSTFSNLLGTAGLTEALGGTGPFTVFAPTNAAFATLDPATFASLTGDPTALRRALQYHVLAGTINAADLQSGGYATIAGSSTVDIIVTPERAITVNNASVTRADLFASNGVIHTIDVVLLPADLGFSAPPPADGIPTTVAAFSGGRMVLSGAVATDTQRQSLRQAVAAVMASDNIDDQLVVDGTAATTDAAIAAVASLLMTMPGNLASGEIGVTPTSLIVTGVYLDDAKKAVFEQAASTVGVAPTLSPRPTATATDATSLEAELNNIVDISPILFNPGRATITPASQSILDRVAAIANTYRGTGIVVQGHTDSDGNAAGNQLLSERRAAAVREALIARGVAADTLSAVGFGESQPVLVGGVESKGSSRRVVFAVTVN